MQFLLWNTYCWPKYDLFMSKHISELKIQHLILVLAAIRFTCYSAKHQVTKFTNLNKIQILIF
jgi:hypothetical protein